MGKVTGQVTEDFFRSQLLEELGSTNFDDDAADTAGFAPGQLYFFTYSAQTKQPSNTWQAGLNYRSTPSI